MGILFYQSLLQMKTHYAPSILNKTSPVYLDTEWSNMEFFQLSNQMTENVNNLKSKLQDLEKENTSLKKQVLRQKVFSYW